ncbi:MAG: pyridoxal-phosphate dependent enzyme, partial [Lentimicrobiaceae bacterium]|nr:pyridoxal-phosphate dependent enzyme [Lentimicrobiaceae bacterium]
MIHHPTKEEIESACQRLKAWVHRTPVLSSSGLNSLFGGSLFFKCENFQRAGAFKFRGAINALLQLDSRQLRQGVATHSSGNHAAALSLAASLVGTTAYIVMPENSNPVKIAATQSYGGAITFCAPTLLSREKTLETVVSQTGAIEIHPYNNLQIIAGQSTSACELFEEVSGIDQIIAPVGGGGLLSGTALASRYFSPATKVIGAEPLGADDAYRSFVSRQFIPAENPQT